MSIPPGVAYPPSSTTNDSGLTLTTSTQSTNNFISGTSTSMGMMDNASTLTVSLSLPLESNIGYAVGVALGGLMVVMVVAVGMIVVVLLVVKRGQKDSIKVGAIGDDVQPFNNALYDKGEKTRKTIRCIKSERHA